MEEQHPPPHLPQHPTLRTPSTLSLQQGDLLTCVCVRVCLVLVCLFVCPWVDGSNGSGTSEDLFWKLDALQTFIRDLHWPEEEFAKHLESRIKLMSSNMIENCVKRCVRNCQIPCGTKCQELMLYYMFSTILPVNISLALQH